MYERTEQHNLADVLLDKMTRKFKKSCKVHKYDFPLILMPLELPIVTYILFVIQVWLRKIQLFLKKKSDGVQSVVNRALMCLPRHKHIKFISQSAILEFKTGVPDRGRSMFEGMLREYPKRTDLWSVYLDQVIP